MERKEQSCEDRGEGGMISSIGTAGIGILRWEPTWSFFLRIEARDMWLQPSEWAGSGDRALEIYETQRPWECGHLWVSLTQRK